MSKIHLGILVAIAGCSLWFLGNASLALFHFLALSRQAPAEVKAWEIVTLGPSAYVLAASYEYELQGRLYQGKSQLKEPVYLNFYAAETDLKKIKTTKQAIWYRASRPEISSLQKIFPYKPCLYFGVTAALFVYFLLVGKFFEQQAKESKIKPS